MLRHRLLALAAAAAATVALSACGGTGTSSDPYDSAPDPTTESAAPEYGAPSSVAAPADVPALTATDQAELGTIVADGTGLTLYRFDEDTAEPPTTTCVDACAATWPPVTVDPKGKLTLDGVDQGGVGMVARPDGTTQLTLGGWPVYRYAQDTTPGETAGQGVGGTWFAIAPDGRKATGTP